MKGWFNAFRDDTDNGPTFYSFNNRTSVNGDVTVISIFVIFSTIYIAFLLVFPGIRKEVRHSVAITPKFKGIFETF